MLLLLKMDAKGENAVPDERECLCLLREYGTPERVIAHCRGVERVARRMCEALKEKGYNPISQIVGYILSEDPTYITTHSNARSLIRRIDRDELLHALVKSYLDEGTD